MQDTAKTNLRYDGEALKDHAIEIDILCPSLNSLSKLMKESNRIINKDKPEIKIKVNADKTQNCFELQLSVEFGVRISTNPDIEFFPYIVPTLKINIPNGDSQNKIEINLFSLIKKFKGRLFGKHQTKEHGKNVKITDDNGKITVVNGDVYNLYCSRDVLEHMKGVLKPLKSEGINEIAIGGKDNSISFDEADLKELTKNLRGKRKTEMTGAESTISERILYLPKKTFNINTKKWSFSLDSPDGKIISVDISGTRIADDAIERGGVRFGDSYTVMLHEIAGDALERGEVEHGSIASMPIPQETEFKTAERRKTSYYKITKVLKFPKNEQ